MSSDTTLIFSLNYKMVKYHSKNTKRNDSFILNMEAEDIFGNTDMQINYLKYYVEKVARFKYGPE